MITDAWRLGTAGASHETSFDALFVAHYGAVFRLLYRITGTHEEAEDLAQEAFLRLYRARRLWATDTTGQENVGGWLYRVATNLALNALRGHARRQRREERASQGIALHGSPAPDPAETALRDDTRATVRRVLARLPMRQAQLLLLRYAGLSYRELAEALGMAPGSVGTTLSRAEAAFEAAYQAGAAGEGGFDAL